VTEMTETTMILIGAYFVCGFLSSINLCMYLSSEPFKIKPSWYALIILKGTLLGPLLAFAVVLACAVLLPYACYRFIKGDA